jgi:hypothetical protein
MRLVGLWTQPADVDAFEREYLGSHVPKLEALPGNAGVHTARCIDGPFFRLTEVLLESLHRSLLTPTALPPSSASDLTFWWSPTRAKSRAEHGDTSRSPPVRGRSEQSPAQPGTRTASAAVTPVPCGPRHLYSR